MKIKIEVPIVLSINDYERIRELRSDIIYLLSKVAEHCSEVETNDGYVDSVEWNNFKIISLDEEGLTKYQIKGD